MSIQTIFEVTFKDGRLYRVTCDNTHQKRRFLQSKDRIKELVEFTSVKINGIHTVKEWEQIVENEL